MISAILAERRAELGLLLAVGIRGWQLVRLILAEAVIVTTVVTHSPNLAQQANRIMYLRYGNVLTATVP
jgi:hypothetical protein